ncbi:hypothetical protein [Nonomuraea rubra]|uniref:hypothetical protein n=1 Tax=Nonomuraea rubra TaxID=46180 RepID=UPI0031EA5E89
MEARHGWRQPYYPHERLREALSETHGVVVFHEQVLKIISVMTGARPVVRRDVAAHARHARGAGQGAQGVRAAVQGQRVRRRGRGAGLAGAGRVRLVRVLQGARGGVRAADVPVGLAQAAPRGGVLRRGAHARARHVPAAGPSSTRPGSAG